MPHSFDRYDSRTRGRVVTRAEIKLPPTDPLAVDQGGIDAGFRVLALNVLQASVADLRSRNPRWRHAAIGFLRPGGGFWGSLWEDWVSASLPTARLARLVAGAVRAPRRQPRARGVPSHVPRRQRRGAAR